MLSFQLLGSSHVTFYHHHHRLLLLEEASFLEYIFFGGFAIIFRLTGGFVTAVLVLVTHVDATANLLVPHPREA